MEQLIHSLHLMKGNEIWTMGLRDDTHPRFLWRLHSWRAGQDLIRLNTTHFLQLTSVEFIFPTASCRGRVDNRAAIRRHPAVTTCKAANRPNHQNCLWHHQTFKSRYGHLIGIWIVQIQGRTKWHRPVEFESTLTNINILNYADNI